MRVHVGHSAVDDAVELGRRPGAESVAPLHDPGRTDDEIDAIERALRVSAGPDVVASREGATIDLPALSIERSA